MTNLTKENIIKIISENKKILKEKFLVKNIYLFGSYVKNQEKIDSDIDFIVEFEKKENPLIKLELGVFLDELLQKESDIGELDDLTNEVKSYVQSEMVLC